MKKSLNVYMFAIIVLCLLVSMSIVRQSIRHPEEDSIRAAYADYCLTFPADGPQSVTELLAGTPCEERTSENYTWKAYDAAAFAPYLDCASVESVETSPVVKNSVYITYISAAGERVVLAYTGDELAGQTVYDPATDTAYEISPKKVSVYKNFSTEGSSRGIFSFFTNLFK